MDKLLNRISYNAPSGFCAPEQFTLYLRNSKGKDIKLNLNSQLTSTLGYLYYTDKVKLHSEITKYIRTKTIFRNKKELHRMIFELDNGGYIEFSHDKVNQYDINNKLRIYKAMKKQVEEQNLPIEVRTGKMIEYGIFEEVEQKENIISLTGRIKII